ncbi:MAG: tRNA-binding protein [Nitrosopumilus sp.]|nr:tRNA-binding protein [Nitrosopumilus sp.]CAI9831246.1 putative methionyl-tRNA synthetase, beta subunit [Nitrosopumilaceae archaeon]MDA7940726.1 tRNA-binding protein [Nitrosopumilus sp.]MDA7942934.1 tRNA-binding protein [Nitrosopumilus sp.]MDA7944655.1 tRNA-binding protein [Nitrosopumilus sp.]
MVTYDEFARLDVRAARVTSAEPIPGKTRIMRGVVDIGGESRSVIIGGAEHHSPEDMVGRAVVVVANLEPKEVAGVVSEAMLLAADVDGVPFWLSPGDAPPGSRVS